MNSPLMVGLNAAFDEAEIRTKQKNVLNILWNSLRYFVLYANKFDWDSEKLEESDHILDIWIRTRLEETKKIVIENFESYIVPPAVEAVESFVDDLSRWYIRRSRDRISEGDNKALSTLYTVLYEFSMIAAPIIPFMTENIFQVLRTFKDPESVHLAFYPEFNEEFFEVNRVMLPKMASDREIVSDVLAIRDKEQIGLRQPLSDFATTKRVNYSEIVKQELNVKDIKEALETLDDLGDSYVIGEKSRVALNTKITEELEVEGEKRNVVRNLQKARKKAGVGLGDKVNATIPDSPLNKKVLKKFKEEIKQDVDALKIEFGPDYEVEKV